MKRNQLIQEIDLSSEVLDDNFSETVFLIGRSRECHVVLEDKQISREHSKLIRRKGKWYVEVVSEETLPLLVNEEVKSRVEIKTGDVLRIGQFSINIDSVALDRIDNVLSVINVKENDGEFVDFRESNNQSEMDIYEKNQSIIDQDKNEIQDFSDEDLGFSPTDGKELQKEVVSEKEEIIENDFLIDQDHGADSYLSNEPLEEGGLDSSGEIVISESEGEVVQDENNPYSLENIENSDFDSESTRVMQTFSSVHLELFGETAPYDKYILEKEKTYIGRDPAKCQIILKDGQVSSVHALVTRNNVMVTLEDLNSANGTILNGARINKVQLNHNDEFVIGDVTFTIKFRSQFLAEEHNRLMPVEDNQSIEVEEIIEVPVEEGETVNAFGEVESSGPPEKSIIKRIWKDNEKRKKLIYVIVGLSLLWVMFDEDSPPQKVGVKQGASSLKDGKLAGDKNGGISSTDPNKRVKLTEEQKRKFSEYYQIGKNHFDNGRYRDALEEFDKITAVDPFYNNTLPSLVATAKEGLKRLEEQERKRREEEAQAERKLKIKKLLEEARKYVEEHNVELANDIFQKITTLDPENFEMANLKRALKSWEDEKKRKELEEAQKKAERESKVRKLAPAKNLFLQKEWYKTIGKLDEFLKVTPMDEDLTKEATSMLKISKEEISAAVNPLLGKAKSLQEGQDLKGAYEIYQQILKFEPSNAEALNQTTEIKETLMIKARKIYREAIISESLSLFQDAKEKFQEVQQVSPSDSEYYRKASDKLKDYLE